MNHTRSSSKEVWVRLTEYGLGGSFRLLRDLILTRLWNRRARLIRRPFYLRGSRYISFGFGMTTGTGVRIDALSANKNIVLKFGDGIQLNDNVHIAASKSVTIGNRVLIASKVFISDHNHGTYGGNNDHSDFCVAPAERPLEEKAVIIKDDVWIGEHVCILPGVTIGKGAIIGAGAIVTRDVPEACIAIGNPARVVKRFNALTKKWELL